MEKIPTAEEFLTEAGFPGHAKHGLAKKWMVEFAKLHVEQALRAASETEGLTIDDYVSVLDSYPLENIK